MKNQNSPIIVLAGYSAAGKTTIGGILGEQYGLDYIPHQKLVHELAEKKGYERARHWLADVGVESFITESVQGMVRKIEESENDRGVVVDASYGKFMVGTLRETFPGRRLIVVSVETSGDVREERIGIRMGGVERSVAIEELNFRDKFLREAGVEDVICEADIRILNIRDMETTISDLTNKLGNLGINL